MGAVIKLIDALLFVFFLEITLSTPTLSAQVVLPSDFFPKFLVDLYHWYANSFGDYLFIEKPAFFIGLAWLHLLVVYPVTLLNLYAIVGGKSGKSPWFNNTCLIYGASALTSRVAILAEMIISTRITCKVKFVQILFTGVAVLAIVRGLLVPCRDTAVASRKRGLEIVCNELRLPTISDSGEDETSCGRMLSLIDFKLVTVAGH